MKVGTVSKQPGEKISVSITYDESLDQLDGIQTVDSCIVSPAGTLTAIPVLVTEKRVRIWLENGVDGEIYKVTITVSTVGGERFEDELTIKVREI